MTRTQASRRARPPGGRGLRLAGWGVVGALALTAVVLPMACSSAPQKATAFRIESREQLVGGRRALAEVGDFKLSNGIIQAIVQDVGHSRGFGAFGGSLIDIDRVRGGAANPSTGVAGNDQFTEMFPAFFLEAMEPSKVEVAADGRDGGPAIIRVSGKGNQFLSMAKGFNELVLGNAAFDYQVDYILEPGASYLRAEVTVTNPGDRDMAFSLDVPTGYITLLGAGQRLFVPGKAGYDMRFRLDEVYAQPVALNALPGEVSEMVVTEGHGVSYAFAIDPKGATYLHGPGKQAYYPTATRDSMLIPLAYSSFLGTYWGKLPNPLPPKKSYRYAAYLAVGHGDVASAQKVIYDLKQTPVGRVSGRVVEEKTGARLDDVSVVLQDDQGNYVSSARTREGGVYVAHVPPGRYRAIAVAEARTPVTTEGHVEVTEGGTARLDVTLPRSAYLAVNVVDDAGRPIPAKVSVEGTHPHDEAGRPPWKFLYDLRAGEQRRSTDFVPDLPDDPGTRRYLETFFFVRDGKGGQAIRPGSYTVYVSRGIEYDVASVPVTLSPGEQRQVSVRLTHVMKTPDYVSGDFHVHSEHSVDSDMALEERVMSYAAEGVDYIAATDHNYVTDLRPVVERLGLEDWLATSVGLELTTLEMGHFNAWPLKYQKGPVTHGAFNWFRVAPGELFAKVRSAAAHGPENIVVQVNHPRDTIMGYFNAFNVSSYTAQPLPPTGVLRLDQEPQKDEEKSPYHYTQFSYDFDTLEVFNGKRQDLLKHYRIPENPPPGPEPTVPIPAPGEILEERVAVEEGVDCDDEPVESLLCRMEPAYPGGLEDYYAFVARGRALTAVGNSDSHDAEDEAGLPRTYLRVGEAANLGTMRAFDELAAIAALKNQRAIVTNGPFVELFVNEQPVGSRVVAPEGTVTVRVKVQAAPWVDVTKVVIVRGGRDLQKTVEVVKTFDVAPGDGLVRLEETFELTGIPDGSFLVAEVSGTRPMWPVYTPYEVPSIAINEAVGAIGATFGFTDKYGRYKPVQTQHVTPFGFTNPIFVDRAARQTLKAAKPVKALGPEGEPVRRRIADLRRLLGGFHGM